MKEILPESELQRDLTYFGCISLNPDNGELILRGYKTGEEPSICPQVVFHPPSSNSGEALASYNDLLSLDGKLVVAQFSMHESPRKDILQTVILYPVADPEKKFYFTSDYA